MNQLAFPLPASESGLALQPPNSPPSLHLQPSFLFPVPPSSGDIPTLSNVSCPSQSPVHTHRTSACGVVDLPRNIAYHLPPSYLPAPQGARQQRRTSISSNTTRLSPRRVSRPCSPTMPHPPMSLSSRNLHGSIQNQGSKPPFSMPAGPLSFQFSLSLSDHALGR